MTGSLAVRSAGLMRILERGASHRLGLSPTGYGGASHPAFRADGNQGKGERPW